MDTGGRIKYDDRGGFSFNKQKRWTPQKDKLLLKVMNQKTGTLHQKAIRYWTHCEKLGLWKNGIPYPTAVIARYYIVRKAVSDTLKEIELQ